MTVPSGATVTGADIDREIRKTSRSRTPVSRAMAGTPKRSVISRSLTSRIWETVGSGFIGASIGEKGVNFDVGRRLITEEVIVSRFPDFACLTPSKKYADNRHIAFSAYLQVIAIKEDRVRKNILCSCSKSPQLHKMEL